MLMIIYIYTFLLLGTISDVPKMSYQKEKIVELDESVHKFGLQVIEGGHLNFGFSSYKTTFQRTSIHDKETLVSIEIPMSLKWKTTTPCHPRQQCPLWLW